MIAQLLTLVFSSSVLAFSQLEKTADGNLDVYLNSNVTAKVGTGAVSANGSLSGFGGIGLGCGINWHAKQSYGGGLQAGSDTFGLGGGFNITEDKMSIGLGIGNTKTNTTSGVALDLFTNGTISLIFQSTDKIECSTKPLEGPDGGFTVACGNAKRDV